MVFLTHPSNSICDAFNHDTTVDIYGLISIMQQKQWPFGNPNRRSHGRSHESTRVVHTAPRFDAWTDLTRVTIVFTGKKKNHDGERCLTLPSRSRVG